MDGCSSATPEMVVGGAAAGTPVACRWNPTKEQISMLETLYSQGLRTPTAEQIQEITGRLQTYGHIEGKNVFYWFQNHKARQRQKEKQDHLSLFRQYNHHHHNHRLCHPPLLHLPPSPNVVYDTCYIPQTNLGFYAQHPQLPSPSMIKRRSPRATTPKSPDSAGFVVRHSPESFVSVAGRNNTMNRVQNEIAQGRNYSYNKETLDLFPLHPTGILQERMETSGTSTCLAPTACTSSSSGSAVDRRYFDFFA